ncbi:hypothetical protein Tco_0180032 [Tanacetum coccineum]
MQWVFIDSVLAGKGFLDHGNLSSNITLVDDDQLYTLYLLHGVLGGVSLFSVGDVIHELFVLFRDYRIFYVGDWAVLLRTLGNPAFHHEPFVHIVRYHIVGRWLLFIRYPYMPIAGQNHSTRQAFTDRLTLTSPLPDY